MRIFSKLITLIFLCLMSVLAYSQQASDTTNIVCDQITSLRITSGLNYFRVPYSDAKCDSVYLMDKFTYVKMDRDIKSCKNFVQLYKIYRDQVKDADKEVGNIIDSYEGIIKTKDDAYNTVLKEYYTLNELLDKSIKQTNDAVSTSKSSLTALNTSLDTIANQSQKLKEDLSELKAINRSNKLVFGAGGVAVGLLIGFFVAR